MQSICDSDAMVAKQAEETNARLLADDVKRRHSARTPLSLVADGTELSAGRQALEVR